MTNTFFTSENLKVSLVLGQVTLPSFLADINFRACVCACVHVRGWECGRTLRGDNN